VISFEQFIMEDGVPIYMQILLFVKRGIVAGKIRHDDELPSRRMLSAFLGVTPNTVQKAYKIEFVRRDLLESDARNVIRAMKQMGVTQDQAVSLIKRFWNEVES
jgi:GntR family transcriptional regulator